MQPSKIQSLKLKVIRLFERTGQMVVVVAWDAISVMV